MMTRKFAEQQTDLVTFLQPGFDPELLNRDSKMWDSSSNDLKKYSGAID
jgi:hypothetical protein